MISKALKNQDFQRTFLPFKKNFCFNLQSSKKNPTLKWKIFSKIFLWFFVVVKRDAYHLNTLSWINHKLPSKRQNFIKKTHFLQKNTLSSKRHIIFKKAQIYSKRHTFFKNTSCHYQNDLIKINIELEFLKTKFIKRKTEG